MGKGVRYKIEHMGDMVADGLEQAFGWAGSSTRGISLTYNIHELEKKRKKALSKIGERLSWVRGRSPELEVFKDERILELFVKLDEIDNKIRAGTRERDERLNPAGGTAEQV
jgi:hypothetical protein